MEDLNRNEKGKTKRKTQLAHVYLVIFACKELNPHDGEYQPENYTNQENVKYTRDGLNQGIHYNLENRKSLDPIDQSKNIQ